MQKWIVVFVVLYSCQIFAESVSNSLEVNTFISDAYEARSTFVNPAALGFQTALNGSALQSSFTYGSTKDREAEFSLGLSYSFLGFGYEKLNSNTQPWNRYSFALGVPVSSQVFLGTRYSFTGSDDPTLSGNHSWDLGVQYRPLRFLSTALQLNRLNNRPSQWGAALTVLPLSRLKFSVDMNTPSDNFGSDLVYQTAVSYEVLPGLTIQGGYHKTSLFSYGIEFAIGQTSLYSHVRPNSDERKWVTGFQTAVLPSRSFLEPKTPLYVQLNSSISEEGSPGSFFSKAEPSLFSILNEIEQASTEPSVSGIVLKIESFPLGLAAAEELNRALLAFRAKGKNVEAYLGNSNIKEYIIASAANKITMEPSAELRVLGPRSERFYVKGTLDKIGVEGEFLAKGEYKSAPETFTRKESSPQSRESTRAELEALSEGIQTILSSSRKQLPSFTALQQVGVFSATEAKAKGLIDEVGSFNSALDVYSGQGGFQEALEYKDNRLNLPSKISIIVAEGDILQRSSRLLKVARDGQITPDKLSRRIRSAVSDPLTKAVVLRISSGGGEILASQEIASAIEAANKKVPVIVSMGDVAASGGYMIAAPARQIFVDSLTVTGSIGVFLGKVSLEGLYKKIDLKKEIIGSSPYLGLFSESRRWSLAEKNLMIHRLNDYYDLFVSYVSDKRKLSKEQVEKAAKGRVWVAKEAEKLKLVDRFGGVLLASHAAAELSNLKAGDYKLEMVGQEFNLFSLDAMDTMFSKTETSLVRETVSLLGTQEAEFLRWMTLFKNEPFLYWTPSLVVE